MKKKNGFTLVELLVVIALMLSILGIAIVSMVNVSNKKKEESWKNVKAQIETAAEEYFTANTYLFEGLNNGATGEISVGKLVEEDYLNKVTNPKTGKAISKCAVVNVTKNGEKYNASFNNGTEDSKVSNCESDNSITVKEAGAPEFDIAKTCENKSGEGISEQNGFCYATTFNLENVKAGGTITSKKYCIGNGTCSLNYDINNINEPISGTSSTTDNGVIGVSLTNQSGATQVKYMSYKIDRTPPTINNEISSENENYNTKKANVKVEAIDKESGVKNIKTYLNDKLDKEEKENSVSYPVTIADNYEESKNLKLKSEACDNVGNCSDGTEVSYDTYFKCKVKKEVKKDYNWNNDCTASCGGGTKTGKTITYYGDEYLSNVDCGNDEGKPDTTSCNTQSCCSSTKVKDYSYGSWSSCSKSCGGGTKTRSKTPNLVSNYNGQSCGTGTQTKESQACNTQSCPTASRCNWDGVNISSHSHQTNNNKTKSYGYDVSSISKATYVNFTFTVPSGMTKVETHAAFCGNYNTCKDINDSNRNQTKVTCTKNTNCNKGWQYVGASVKVSCGGETKVFNYAHKIGDSNTTYKAWE